MSDVVTLARTARESLARGLSALQGDPNMPRSLVDLAAPIAQAMGALHQIERSGDAPAMANAQAALSHVQGALATLQAQPPKHPAVAAAIEAVAGALARVHALIEAAAVPPARPVPPSPPAGAGPAAALAPQHAGAPPPLPPGAQRTAQPTAAASAARESATIPAAEGSPVTAELGAHSASNFYKGLSGNDIIDHGGLFVSTYKLPKIGQAVRLKVALPGGYEFEANAVVRWRREPSDAGSDAPPGFGAQFTEITVEARQLVYRYVRNREPLFHDDL